MTAENSWFILGAGAIGCLWAAYWREDRVPVTLVQRTADCDALLELTREGKTFRYDVAATTAEQQVRSNTPIQRLLICTKAQHTEQALAPLLPCLHENATVLIVQNGLAATRLREKLTTQQLFVGVTTDGAYRTQGNRVTHAGKGITHIGPIDNSAGVLPRTTLPKNLLIKSCSNIEQRMWQKFAINCAVNPLCVKYQCSNGQLLELPEARRELSSLCDEITAIASQLKPAPWFQSLEDDACKVLSLTAENINSMLQDFRQGKETEICELNGYLVKLAALNNLDSPLNTALIRDIAEG